MLKMLPVGAVAKQNGHLPSYSVGDLLASDALLYPQKVSTASTKPTGNWPNASLSQKAARSDC